jgi:integrase
VGQMFRLFIDTDVWLHTAADPRLRPQLTMLEEMIRRGLIKLIVPELLLEEFHRKREQIAQASEIGLVPHARAVKEAALQYGGKSEQVTEWLKYLDELVAHGPFEGGGTAQALDRMERLLQQAPALPTSESIVAAAVRRGIDKRAPFHGRNGMADALLFETYAQLVRKADAKSRFIFLTHNKRDFSDLKTNDNLPHPDLIEAFSTGRSAYFIDSLAALKTIDAALVAEVLTRTQPTVAELIEAYLANEQGVNESHNAVLRRIVREEDLGKKRLSGMRPQDFVEYARSQHKKYGALPPTVHQHFYALQGAFNWGHEHWSADIALEAFKRGRKQAQKLRLSHKTAKETSIKRLDAEDEKRLLELAEKRSKHPVTVIHMADVITFALWSARRQKEICSLRWEDFDEEAQTCWVREPDDNTKKKLRFPLLGPALEIVKGRRTALNADAEYIFPYNQHSMSQAFQNMKTALKIDFDFDDLKEEGIRRLLESDIHPYTRVLQLDPEKVSEIKKQMSEL